MKNGPYELVIAPPEYPGRLYRGRYVYEHHLVWWQNTGEVPGEGFDVHHRNKNKRDNRFLNLEKKTHADHSREHGLEKSLTPIQAVCGYCEEILFIPPRKYRARMKQSKSGVLYCGYSCQMKAKWSSFQGG